MSARSRGGYTTDRVIPPASWTRCHAYMERKVRFCYGQVAPGSKFCGAHQTADSRPRVPCPIDPSHTVFHDMVDAHRSKCPKYVELQQQQQQAYYCRDCNTGGVSDSDLQLATDGTETHPVGDLEWAQQLALRVVAVHQKIFALMDCDSPATVAFEDIQAAIPLMDLGQDEMDAGLEQVVSALRIKSGGLRHLKQQASFIGHLRRIGALDSLHKKPKVDPLEIVPSKHRIVLEVGAGRGITGLLVSGVSAVSRSTKLVMVEREAPRSRADKNARRGTAKPDNVTYSFDISNLPCERIKCDLAHVRLDVALNLETKDELLVIAKHLCGCGTDLALKALLPLANQVTTLIMSTCCHGACNWNDFVGRAYVYKAMTDGGLFEFGEKEFKLLQQWSAGTVKVLDTKVNNKTVEKSGSTSELYDEHGAVPIPIDFETQGYGVTKVVESLGLACGEQGLGRACQRIIDYGRREFMRNELRFGDAVELVYYVPDSTTPQNALLIARRWN